MNDALRTPEEVAAGLVTVKDYAERGHAVTIAGIQARANCVGTMAERLAATAVKNIAAAIADDRRARWEWAVGEPPVGAEREGEIREAIPGPDQLNSFTLQMFRDLLALLNHAREQLAHLGCDEGLALARAFDLGRRAGWKECRAACVEKADEANREWGGQGAGVALHALQSVPEVPPEKETGR